MGDAPVAIKALQDCFLIIEDAENEPEGLLIATAQGIDLGRDKNKFAA